MLSDDLKEQTKTNHQQLEKKLVAKMRQMKNTADYGDLLGAFYSYFGGLEQLIRQHVDPDHLPDLLRRRKAGALIADLDTLGHDVPAIANYGHLPFIQDHLQALGALYVIEGSTLGGQIITQMLKRQLHITDGMSFFNGYGNETTSMWQKFKDTLDDPANQPAATIINAANETFSKFSDWLDVVYEADVKH